MFGALVFLHMSAIMKDIKSILRESILIKLPEKSNFHTYGKLNLLLGDHGYKSDENCDETDK